MPKKRIEAEVAVDVTGLDKVEKLEDAAERLSDGIEVGVDVDESALQKFERELDALGLDDARELRIEFRAQLLQQQIRTALRDLERLEDPIQIATRTADLERLQAELREVAELAERKYDVEVRIDTKGNARQAAGDIDLIRQRGEGLQSALPALRGFTDEMGGLSVGAGVAGQAMGDLGDFSLILGERFGISEAATAKLGTALGAAGLATVIAGVAIPAIAALIDAQDDLNEETLNAAGALADQAGAVDLLDAAIKRVTGGDPLVAAILGQFGDGEEAEKQIDDIADGLTRLGRTVEDLPEALRQATTEDGIVDFLREIPDLAGQSEFTLRRLAETMADSRKFSLFRTELNSSSDAFQEMIDRNEDAIRAIFDLQDATSNVDLTSAYQEVLTDIRQTEDGVRRLDEAFANVGANASLEDVIAEYQELVAEADEVGEAATRAGDRAAASGSKWADLAETAIGELKRINEGVIESIGEIDAFGAKVDELGSSLDAETSLLDIADQFDKIREAAAKAAEAEDPQEREKALRDYRREQIRLTQDVLDYLDTVEDIPVEVATRLSTFIDQQNYAAAEQLLDELTEDRYSKLTVDILPQLNDAFKTISVRIEPNQAPVQTSTQYSLPPQNITINYPPGTPANTAENQLINQARNGTRTPI